MARMKGGKPKRVIIVLDPGGPKRDARYLDEKGTYTLKTNPEILSEAERNYVIEHGTPIGWVARTHESGEKGPRHERTLKTKDEVHRYLEKEWGGMFASGVQGKDSVYLQQCYRMPDGSVRRIRVDPDKFA